MFTSTIPGPRGVRAGLSAAGVAALAASALVFVPSSAGAAVPAFPDNVVVFPDRDFVSIEGYEAHAGETARVTVMRGSDLVGAATAEVSGTDVAFEVNHPGGVCWGAGEPGGLQVTPDIRAGDVVAITFADGSHDETTTSSATVTEDMTLHGSTLIVVGSIGDDVIPTQMEQRIINPDLVDTAVGKRDIRALPGPPTPDRNGAYTSSLTFPTADTFEATYEFADADTAAIAASADLGERAMSWQVEDADANRQGLTIAEFGEAGGPGFGGCPAGPGQQDAPAGSFSAVRSGDTMNVSWTEATPQPGAAAVTGYSVELIAKSSDGNGQQSLLGRRTNASTFKTAVSGLVEGETYTVEVRSLAGTRMSTPFTLATGTPPADTTVPTLALSPAPDPGGVVEANSVQVTSNGQTFFTTDGSPVISGNLPSDTARLYTGPIPITGPTTVKVASFDDAGNIAVAEGDYRPVTAPAVNAPTGLAGTATQSSVALTWNASPVAEQVTGYQVTVYDADGVKLAGQPPTTTVPRQTVTGLSPGTDYRFTVQAKNAGNVSPESGQVTVRTAVLTDRITITTARWKSNDFRVVGTGDKLGAIVTLYRVNADGSRGAAIPGATAAVVAAAPPGIGDWTIRLRNGTPNPGRIFAVSDGGGVVGPFTVSNG